MNVSFNQLDDAHKSLHFLSGTYPVEYDKNTSWIWTADYIYGTISNVNYILFKAFSEIDNFLIYENERIDIKSNSLNIIKLNVTDKTEFEFRLESSFNPVNDTRELGIKIIGILVDGEVIF